MFLLVYGLKKQFLNQKQNKIITKQNNLLNVSRFESESDASRAGLVVVRLAHLTDLDCSSCRPADPSASSHPQVAGDSCLRRIV